LDLAVPFIGIISPQGYLDTMGWQLIPEPGRQHNFVKIVPILKPPTSTNHSVSDVVNFCYNAGYVTSSGTSAGYSTNLMNFAIQPREGNSTAGSDSGDTMDSPFRVAEPPSSSSEVTRAGFDANDPSVHELFHRHEGPCKEKEVVEGIENIMKEFRASNEDDVDSILSPFNPLLHQAAFHYDPIAHEPFDGYNIDDMIEL
jgi:hypothetical protein